VLCAIATFLAYAPAPSATIGAEADALHLDEP